MTSVPYSVSAVLVSASPAHRLLSFFRSFQSDITVCPLWCHKGHWYLSKVKATTPHPHQSPWLFTPALLRPSCSSTVTAGVCKVALIFHSLRSLTHFCIYCRNESNQSRSKKIIWLRVYENQSRCVSQVWKHFGLQWNHLKCQMKSQWQNSIKAVCRTEAKIQTKTLYWLL